MNNCKTCKEGKLILKNELVSLHETIIEKEKELNKSKDYTNEILKKKELLEAEVSELKSNVVKLNGLVNVNTETIKLIREIEFLQNEKLLYEQRLDAIHNQLDQYNKVIEERDELKSEMIKLKEELIQMANKSQENAIKSSENENLYNKVNELEVENKILKISSYKIQQDHDHFYEKNRTLLREVSEIQDKYDNLMNLSNNRKLSELQSYIDILKSQNNNLLELVKSEFVVKPCETCISFRNLVTELTKENLISCMKTQNCKDLFKRYSNLRVSLLKFMETNLVYEKAPILRNAKDTNHILDEPPSFINEIKSTEDHDLKATPINNENRSMENLESSESFIETVDNSQLQIIELKAKDDDNANEEACSLNEKLKSQNETAINDDHTNDETVAEGKTDDSDNNSSKELNQNNAVASNFDEKAERILEIQRRMELAKINFNNKTVKTVEKPLLNAVDKIKKTNLKELQPLGKLTGPYIPERTQRSDLIRGVSNNCSESKYLHGIKRKLTTNDGNSQVALKKIKSPIKNDVKFPANEIKVEMINFWNNNCSIEEIVSKVTPAVFTSYVVENYNCIVDNKEITKEMTQKDILCKAKSFLDKLVLDKLNNDCNKLAHTMFEQALPLLQSTNIASVNKQQLIILNLAMFRKVNGENMARFLIGCLIEPGVDINDILHPITGDVFYSEFRVNYQAVYEFFCQLIRWSCLLANSNIIIQTLQKKSLEFQQLILGGLSIQQFISAKSDDVKQELVKSIHQLICQLPKFDKYNITQIKAMVTQKYQLNSR